MYMFKLQRFTQLPTIRGEPVWGCIPRQCFAGADMPLFTPNKSPRRWPRGEQNVTPVGGSLRPQINNFQSWQT